jgi:hypothetical protein
VSGYSLWEVTFQNLNSFAPLNISYWEMSITFCCDGESNLHYLQHNYSISLVWFKYCQTALMLSDMIPITTNNITRSNISKSTAAVCIVNWQQRTMIWYSSRQKCCNIIEGGNTTLFPYCTCLYELTRLASEIKLTNSTAQWVLGKTCKMTLHILTHVTANTFTKWLTLFQCALQHFTSH